MTSQGRKNRLQQFHQANDAMKNAFVNIAIIVVLLTQVLTEASLSIFGTASAYYIAMRALHIGFLPSILLYFLLKSDGARTVGFTLILLQSMYLGLEVSATIPDYSDYVLKITKFDWFGGFFVFLAITLTVITDALTRSGRSIIYRLRGPLSKDSENERVDSQNTKRNER